MKPHKIIYFLFFVLLFSELSIGKDSLCVFPKQIQIYKYEDENIQLIFETSKVNFCDYDTLEVTMKFKNISSKIIHVLKKSYSENKHDKKGIIFEYGGDILRCEYCINELEEIEPNSEYLSSYSFLVKELKKEGLKGNIELILDVGYIFNFDSLKLNDIIKNEENFGKYYFNSNKLYMSSLIFDFFKININCPVLWVYLKE